MSKTLSENSANATFGTGLTYPVDGDSGNIWWDLIESDIQQLADRSQALKSLIGASTANERVVTVPLIFQDDLDTGNQVLTSNRNYLTVDNGQVAHLHVPPLPIGMKIKSAYMYFQGGGAGTLPSPMPKIELYKQVFAVGTDPWGGSPGSTLVGTQLDTTAVLATYNLVHTVTLTLSETIPDDAAYTVKVTGGTGATTAVLWGVRLTIGL